MRVIGAFMLETKIGSLRSCLRPLPPGGEGPEGLPRALFVSEMCYLCTWFVLLPMYLIAHSVQKGDHDER